ncbi:Dna2/Cas4 domain-containing protein, partial [Candidatus Woesearchaeota archaeon]|nr:Dna2/Cas4 domain-containing protein [Candidatus Woesearchaeota archaeon]
MQKLLSKSKYLNGLQCPKLLWISVNDKTKMPEVSESTQKLFDQGQIVGEYAKKLFPEGINIPVKDFNKNLNDTKELLTKNKPLFEPAFLINRLYSRADILEPTNNGWNIIEVKSSTEVKEVNIQDVAFQRYVYEKAGLKIDRCYLLHINNKYVRHGDINPKELFTKEDITIPVNEELKFVDDRVIEMLEIIDGKEPNTTISKNCKEPYECQMKELCWSFLPKENSVF